MRIFENYGSYWPVLVPAVCFLLLGLWLWLVSERAMEAAPKQLRWISEYRRPGFPFRAERMPFPPLRWPAVVAVALIAAAWQGLILLNTGFAILHSWTALNPTRYTWMLMVVAALGTAAVYVLLQLLYESGFSAFLGALLFAVSPTDSQGPTCLLAIALLLAVLYLRAEKPGFPAELRYLGAILALCLGLSVCAPMVWLIPALIAVHLYKLIWQLRNNRIGVGPAALSLAAALVCWIVCLYGASVVRLFILTGGSVSALRKLISAAPSGAVFRSLRRAVGIEMTVTPGLGRLVDPLIDAPLSALGVWGAVSAAGMACKRRNPRAVLVLIVAALLGLVWLLSARWLLPLGLALTLGAMLRNAELGNKRVLAVIPVAIGALYDIWILLATWGLPLNAELTRRLLCC
ncbi:MAG: hypothetical protein II382_01585 [Oscillospiraceae bacterium]|jgi:hypothetical protein|nr:hypothetical protein [Oscillospiraceae bacterium]